MKNLTITNGFSRMRDDNLLVKANSIHAAIPLNPVFLDPVPSMTDLENAIQEYSEALEASRDGDRLKVAIKNQKKAQLVEVLHLLADFVLFKSEGDRVVAMSSGFTISKDPSPREPITKPQNPRILPGLNSGELVGKIKRVKGAVSYVHQVVSEADLAQDKWTSVPSSRITCVLTSLQAGTCYYYRVAALGTKDQLIYSDVVSRIAA